MANPRDLRIGEVFKWDFFFSFSESQCKDFHAERSLDVFLFVFLYFVFFCVPMLKKKEEEKKIEIPVICSKGTGVVLLSLPFCSCAQCLLKFENKQDLENSPDYSPLLHFIISFLCRYQNYETVTLIALSTYLMINLGSVAVSHYRHSMKISGDSGTNQ